MTYVSCEASYEASREGGVLSGCRVAVEEGAVLSGCRLAVEAGGLLSGCRLAMEESGRRGRRTSPLDSHSASRDSAPRSPRLGSSLPGSWWSRSRRSRW